MTQMSPFEFIESVLIHVLIELEYMLLHSNLSSRLIVLYDSYQETRFTCLLIHRFAASLNFHIIFITTVLLYSWTEQQMNKFPYR